MGAGSWTNCRLRPATCRPTAELMPGAGRRTRLPRTRRPWPARRFLAGCLRSRGGWLRSVLGPVARDLQPDADEDQGEAEDGPRDQRYQVSAGHMCLPWLRAY